MNIPSNYLNDLIIGTHWQKNLSIKIMNDHFTNHPPKNFLVRTVQDKMMSFLSDKYKRSDKTRFIV
jgi:hypothetical protein